MRRRAKPGFLLVAAREWRWLLHDRVALVLMFGVPLFAFVVLAAVFSQPVIRGLGVVVVDADRSDTSRALIEQVAASPNLSIAARAGDLASAASAIRSGEAIAAIYIPANFERDVKAERRPQVVGFYNQQYLTAAGIAATGLSDGLSAATASAAPATHAAPKQARIGSLVAETIVLVNPQKNYAQFMLRALLPTIIHVVIALAGGYAVGSEFRRRSVRTWLACAGGNPIIALAGKLAPLFAIFFLIMLAVPLVLEGLLEIRFRGDVPMIVAAASLLIIAYLALAALLQLLVGDLSTGLGLTGLVVSPAFGYAGVGFPMLGMNALAYAWGAILPLRWYMEVLLGQGARGLPVSDSARPFAALAALTALYVLLALLQLRAVAGRLSRRTAADDVVLPVDRPGVAGAFAGEWQRVLAIRGAFILLIGAPLIYGIYYPQPYLNQILRKLPIAVVDADQSELGRRIVETLDASGAVSVVARARTLADARVLIDRGDAFAAVGIPPGTERDVLKGVTAHIPIYADATYLFLFRSLSSGIAVAINTLSSAGRGARTDGSLVKATLAAASPADVLLQPIFNPVGGYASYIVPAAFLLILQQTLLIGGAFLTSVALAQRSGGAVASVLGRGIAHLTIYLPALALYLIVLPRIYGFSTLGDPLQLLALGLVFLLATSFMAQSVGAWFKRPETPTLIFLATSLPQFFLTGVAWPREAIPQAALVAGHVFRSTSRSTASSASASWVRALRRWGRIGAGSGSWPSSISRWPWFRRMSSSRRRVGCMHKAKSVAVAAFVLAALAGFYLLWRPEAATPIGASYARPRSASRLRSAASSPQSRSSPARACARATSSRSFRGRVDRIGRAGARAARRRGSLARPRLCRRRAEQVASLAADIAKAKARLDYTQAQMTRVSTLASNDFAAQQALDQSENDVANARADVAEAEANHQPLSPDRRARSAPSPTRRCRLRPPRWRCSRAASTSPSCARQLMASSVSSSPRSVGTSAPATGARDRGNGQATLSFDAREDLLHGLTVGASVDVPAGGSGAAEKTPVLVTELRPLGTFATCRPSARVAITTAIRCACASICRVIRPAFEPGMPVWLVAP